MNDNPRKCKFWSFSLRFLLVVLVAAAGVLGWWNWKADRINQQWLAVESLVEKGALVTAEPAEEVPDWMLWTFPEGKSGNIIELTVSNQHISTEKAERMGKHLSRLRSLNLTNVRIDDEAMLKLIDGLDSVTQLKVRRTDITDRSIQAMMEMPSLQELDVISNADITWRSVRYFVDHPEINAKHNLEDRLYRLVTGEVAQLLELGLSCRVVKIQDPTAEDLTLLVGSFEELFAIEIEVNEPAKFDHELLGRVEDIRSLDQFHFTTNGQQQIDLWKNCLARRSVVDADSIVYYRSKDYCLLSVSYNYNSRTHFFRCVLPAETEGKPFSELYSLNNAKAIKISVDSGLKDDLLVLDQCKNLELLQLAHIDWNEENSQRIYRLKNLKSLQLKDIYSTPNELPKPFIDRLECKQQLQELAIRGSKLTDDQLRSIAKLPNLKKFEWLGNFVPSNIRKPRSGISQLSLLQKWVAEETN